MSLENIEVVLAQQRILSDDVSVFMKMYNEKLTVALSDKDATNELNGKISIECV